MGLIVQRDDPLAGGVGAGLADDAHPLAGQGMMGVDDADISRRCVRFGGILLRTIRFVIVILQDMP